MERGDSAPLIRKRQNTYSSDEQRDSLLGLNLSRIGALFMERAAP